MTAPAPHPIPIPLSIEADPLLALPESEEWFRAVFDSSAIGIAILDMQGRFLAANAAFLRMVGYCMRELRGIPFTELNHPDDDAHNLPLFRELTQGRLPDYQIEKRYRCKDGSVLPVRLTTSLVRGGDGAPRFCVAMVEDIAERQRAEAAREALAEELRFTALHDPLTGLPNRALFMQRLQEAVTRAGREPDYRFATLFLDLDRFKVVNDSLGHVMGDRMLQEVGSRLRACLRPADTVARLGGDEFAILLEGVDGAEKAARVAEKILEVFGAPVDLGGYEAFTTTSIGIVLSDESTVRPEELLRNADTAMYHSRASGVGRYAVYDRSMHAAALERLQLETDLRHALRRGEFRLFYQPLVCLFTGEVVGLEALLRWEHPHQGLVPPDKFIPLAEDTGVIVQLGGWVLGEAVRQLADWRARLPGLGALELSVNISSRQLRSPRLVEDIEALLLEHRVPASQLKLELTESSIVADPSASTDLLRRLRGLGVHIHLDDFGTGYSSLGHLHSLPLDALKVDRSFVQCLGETRVVGRRSESEIVRTIVTLARSLGVRVVAEGVETQTQLAALRALGCEFGQGHLFSPAVDAAAIEERLRQPVFRW